MWKKGELVWVTLNPSESWIPGRIQDPSNTLGVLISFFGLMEPRYVPKPCLRSFDRDFGALVADSWRFRRFVNRALRAHFWNISFGLWCSCQPPIDSPHFDEEKSLPWFPLTSDPALGYVRDMAISLRVPLRRLAETNSSTAQILSFRRYTVDFNRSESVYEEIRESAKLMDTSEESDWYLETSDADVENSRVMSLGDPLPKDIPCCSSPSFEQPFDKAIQICTWSSNRNLLTNSGSSVMKACGTTVRTSDHEDDCHSSKSREQRCEVEQSICLLNSEPLMEDLIEEDTTNAVNPRVAVSEVPRDVIMTETHDDCIVDASKDKAFLAKPVSFAVPKACKSLASSVKEAHSNPRNKLVGSMISTQTLDEESSDKNSFNGTRENCFDNALKSQIVEVGNKELRSDDLGTAPAEQLQDLEAAASVESQTRADDNVKSIGIKRKASRDKASTRNSKRKKKAGQQSVTTDKPLDLHLKKDMRLADPKCLRMKFLGRHVNLPSKSELLKRFSVFGKIDASRTDVNPGESSAKVVFLQSIDAVTAYQFARGKKFKLGRSKVVYRLDAFEQDNEVNKDNAVNQVPVSEKPQMSVPSPRSCLKKHGSVDKEEGRSPQKVKFQMETN
ncbi:unnamed protein product [Microthlaspi erraticum]|uniref:Uncharacterized protein n=1 Tax=Microthlaspi erraticum TaxID=1685480 RepID=A0A6D2KKI1_9BRAS|nr:unnamed protein product [Microthlaspi erraticum]